MREHNAIVVGSIYAAIALTIFISWARSRSLAKRAERLERARLRPARRRTDSVATGAGFSQSVALDAAPRRQRGGPPPRARESRAYPLLRAVPDEDHAA